MGTAVLVVRWWAGAHVLNDAFLTLNETNASFIACRPARPTPPHDQQPSLQESHTQQRL
jgi:hypothetical protein